MAEAPKPKKDAFAAMMKKARGEEEEEEPQPQLHKKPAHRPPTDGQGNSCKWNGKEGRWEADEQYRKEGWVRSADFKKWEDPNAAPIVKRKVGRPSTKPAANEVAAPPAKKQKEGRRVVQPGWYKILPSLMLSACCQVECKKSEAALVFLRRIA